MTNMAPTAVTMRPRRVGRVVVRAGEVMLAQPSGCLLRRMDGSATARYGLWN